MKTWHWKDEAAYVFLKEWLRLGREARLRGQDMRLLCGLLGHCGWGNLCDCTVTQAGLAVGLAASTVVQSSRRLVAAKLIILEPARDNRRGRVVSLTPALVWRGRPWLRTVALRHFHARWQLCHGTLAERVASAEEASRGVDGTKIPNTPPFPAQHPLIIMSSR